MIFTLLYNQGAFMLSRNFSLQKVGNLRWLKKNYNFSTVAFSIDELIVLDISRNERNPSEFCSHLKSLADDCFVPIAAGGGVKTLLEAKTLLRSGADKVVLNTALFEDQALVEEIAVNFGQQCIVASIDVKYNPTHGYQIWVENGQRCLASSFSDLMEDVINLPIGEIYLNSIDRDGTGQGYDLDMLSGLPDKLSVPLIDAGGAGHYRHLAEGFSDDRVDAFATAHLFNFVGDGLVKARQGLISENHSLAVWNIEQSSSLKGSLSSD